MKQVITNNAQETIELGIQIGKVIKQPMVILLDGDLAAGKTTFTQGLAKGLGIEKIVNSPSYTIMKHYPGLKFDLYHLDLYRLDSLGVDFDLEEYLDDGVVVIEWPFQVKELLPKKHLLIKINKIGDNQRQFEFIPNGITDKEVLKCLD
ncbi:MAG: tRNA (adenosine(37)-N6)-threonylcarbamoyltransferase complex ATPase subunit type 1 TsaE [Acholeplasmataceae bacterium]|jgi:tRNA threonylcarbamoyladenosine biosynthesis protein TsaE